MNNEQQSLIDEAYKNYRSKSKDIDLPENLYNKLIDDLNKDAMFPIDNPNRMLTKEEFINKCKTDSEFSEKWGLTIEERELSLEERAQWLQDNTEWDLLVGNLDHDHIREVVEEEAPNKLITITYHNKTIESYEFWNKRMHV
jgi:hypothetical protein